MKCPKCGHVQAESPECTACGIVFAKYEQRHAYVSSQVTRQRKPSRLPWIVVGVVLVLGVLMFSGDEEQPMSQGSAPQPMTSTSTSAAVDTPAPPAAARERPAVK